MTNSTLKQQIHILERITWKVTEKNDLNYWIDCFVDSIWNGPFCLLIHHYYCNKNPLELVTSTLNIKWTPIREYNHITLQAAIQYNLPGFSYMIPITINKIWGKITLMHLTLRASCFWLKDTVCNFFMKRHRK